jgi:hypothetical protein
MRLNGEARSENFSSFCLLELPEKIKEQKSHYKNHNVALKFERNPSHSIKGRENEDITSETKASEEFVNEMLKVKCIFTDSADAGPLYKHHRHANVK